MTRQAVSALSCVSLPSFFLTPPPLGLIDRPIIESVARLGARKMFIACRSCLFYLDESASSHQIQASSSDKGVMDFPHYLLSMLLLVCILCSLM